MSSTRIFARALDGGQQLLAYSMSVALDATVAMVLPIPCPVGATDDAVRFVDMSGCPMFFDDLERLFSPPVRSAAMLELGAMVPQPANLVVHTVGDFEASFVPARADFARLDPRFRLSDAVWRALPAYADWSFCVFKLKSAGGATKKIHPMAFEFPRRDPSTIFFPTVHVHDGQVHASAQFDHILYCQPDASWKPLMSWEASSKTTSALPARARPWVNGSGRLFRQSLVRMRRNEDVVLRERVLRQRHAFGQSYRLRMRAEFESVTDPIDGSLQQWSRVTESERVRICEAVARELDQLFTNSGSAWPLAVYDPEHPVVHPDMAPPGAPEFVAEGTRTACQLVFHAQNARIEPQELSVSFEEVPARGVRTSIASTFRAALDRATAAVMPPD